MLLQPGVLNAVYCKMIKMTCRAALSLIVLGACTPAPEGVSVHDPYEETNREAHEFNAAIGGMFGGDDDEVDDGPAIPVEITSKVVNFGDNVSLPGMVVNGILQGKIDNAFQNSARFVLNTTVGLLGFFDPATGLGLAEVETDFGETLSIWGVPEGAYLELPVLGPSTERALAGRIVDMIIGPLEFVGTKEQIEYATIGKIAGRVIKASEVGDTISGVLDDSADSYAALRLIYLQNRRFELGTTLAQDVADPYDDFYGAQ